MLAIAIACGSVPALARDAPRPGLSIDPISARSLLAPVEDGRRHSPAYRLDPGLDSATGQRARLSLEVGDSTLFAITGRLSREAVPTGPLDPGHARVVGQRRTDSGKVYGAGVAHRVRGIDLTATYQYSKISAEQPESDAKLQDDGPGKSHSLRATARIRFGS